MFHCRSRLTHALLHFNLNNCKSKHTLQTHSTRTLSASQAARRPSKQNGQRRTRHVTSAASQRSSVTPRSGAEVRSQVTAASYRSGAHGRRCSACVGAPAGQWSRPRAASATLGTRRRYGNGAKQPWRANTARSGRAQVARTPPLPSLSMGGPGDAGTPRRRKRISIAYCFMLRLGITSLPRGNACITTVPDIVCVLYTLYGVHIYKDTLLMNMAHVYACLFLISHYSKSSKWNMDRSFERQTLIT